MPRLTGYIRAQRPQEVHPHLPPLGQHAPGFGAPYSDPYQILSQREHTTTPRVREASNGVNRQVQASLHPQWDLPLERLQPAGLCNPGRNTTCHTATAHYTNYALRSPHPFPHSLQHLSNYLCRGVMWEPPTGKQELPNHRSPWQLQHPLVSAPPSDRSTRVGTLIMATLL
jgi:hypothetical protein